MPLRCHAGTVYVSRIEQLRPMLSRTVFKATVTPLASTFGSGFLIIVPVLERTLGARSIVGICGVCLLAWFVGSAIRHNVAIVEPLEHDRRLDHMTRRIDEASDLVIVVAYVISVALYLRIMSQYVVELAIGGSETAERALASGAVLLIVVIGTVRGFSGLEIMERAALGAVLVLTTVLGAALFFHDAAALDGGGLYLPPVPALGAIEVLLVLGGIVITVQGFETVRYLADEYDRETRVWACRLSQVVSSSIYIGFVAVCTPVMGLGRSDGADATLLDITDRVVPFPGIPLVITAVLSQMSAATADTVAADGNLRQRFGGRMRHPRPFVVTGAAAILLVRLVPTFAIIAIASRAFAAYYALQCIVALRTTRGRGAKLGFGLLALVFTLIALLARPAG
jgi:hypothetical protein